jgi:hypothetical protein
MQEGGGGGGEGDEAELEYLPDSSTAGTGGAGGGRYRARDIGAGVVSLGEAVRGWEGRTRVRLEGVGRG